MKANRPGVLTNSKHHMECIQGETMDCGSHGCHGHTSYAMVCTCGFVENFSCYFGSSDNEASIRRKHRHDVINAHLGVDFG